MGESFNERKREPTNLSRAQIAALKHQLSGSGWVVHEPGSKGYAEASRLWNGAVERKPSLVTRCSNTNDVRTALLAAQAAGLPVSVRNGGQDWVGRALRDGGLVLDLTPMRHAFSAPRAPSMEANHQLSLNGAASGYAALRCYRFRRQVIPARHVGVLDASKCLPSGLGHVDRTIAFDVFFSYRSRGQTHRTGDRT
jgi:hypothetical protein